MSVIWLVPQKRDEIVDEDSGHCYPCPLYRSLPVAPLRSHELTTMAASTISGIYLFSFISCNLFSHVVHITYRTIAGDLPSLASRWIRVIVPFIIILYPFLSFYTHFFPFIPVSLLLYPLVLLSPAATAGTTTSPFVTMLGKNRGHCYGDKNHQNSAVGRRMEPIMIFYLPMQADREAGHWSRRGVALFAQNDTMA